VAEIRRDAVKALARTKGPEAIAALRQGLRGSDAIVRALSALGLGALQARDALPELFTALDRHLSEAAAAIGQMCEPAACERLLSRLGALPFNVVVSGLDPMLLRPTPLPDALLLEVVRKVEALGTPEAGRFLSEVRSRWPASGSKAVMQALDAAAAALAGTRP
jgi:HEAT repeats